MRKNHELFLTLSSTGAAAHLTSGVAVSATNTYYSAKISGSNYLSLQLAWTGTPTGTFTVQGSDKEIPNEASDTDWYSITPTQAPSNPAGSAAATSGRVNEFNSRWKRIKYVNASGSGTLTGYAAVGEQM